MAFCAVPVGSISRTRWTPTPETVGSGKEGDCGKKRQRQIEPQLEGVPPEMGLDGTFLAPAWPDVWPDDWSSGSPVGSVPPGLPFS